MCGCVPFSLFVQLLHLVKRGGGENRPNGDLHTQNVNSS